MTDNLDATPPVTDERRWINTVNETLDDMEARITQTEKRNLLLTVGLGVTALGVVATGRVVLKIATGMAEIQELLKGLAGVPARAVTEAKAAEPIVPEQVVVNQTPPPDYVPPNDTVVAPVAKPHDPGPREISDDLKQDLESLDVSNITEDDLR
jgi:hypothetical protein